MVLCVFERLWMHAPDFISIIRKGYICNRRCINEFLEKTVVFYVFERLWMAPDFISIISKGYVQ